MGEKILVVRSDELKNDIDFQHFRALPEEEIHRLYNSIEVLEMDRDLVEHDPTYKQLVAYTSELDNLLMQEHSFPALSMMYAFTTYP